MHRPSPSVGRRASSAAQRARISPAPHAPSPETRRELRLVRQHPSSLDSRSAATAARAPTRRSRRRAATPAARPTRWARPLLRPLRQPRRRERAAPTCRRRDAAVHAPSARVRPRASPCSTSTACQATSSMDEPRGHRRPRRRRPRVRRRSISRRCTRASSVRDGELWVRDLGSRNGTLVLHRPADAPRRRRRRCSSARSSSRFRRLGYPGPHPPEADSTRRMGSMDAAGGHRACWSSSAPTAACATRSICRPRARCMLGRESGDWVFPYDPTMSGRHAEIRSRGREFFVHDAGSRNGVALAVRGDRPLAAGTARPRRRPGPARGERSVSAREDLSARAAPSIRPTSGSVRATARRSRSQAAAPTSSARSSPTAITSSRSSAKAAWARCISPST